MTVPAVSGGEAATETPLAQAEFALWPDGVPGGEGVAHGEQLSPAPDGARVVRNVTVPTLTAVLPDPSRATGAAVIVCPGGAFHMLSLDSEGFDVAQWLAARGAAAFVLKYRLLATPPGEAEFLASAYALLSDRPRLIAAMIGHRASYDADGRQALRTVRDRAAEFGVDPGRVAMVGFSAGGWLLADLLTSGPATERPFVAGCIYTPFTPSTAVPAAAPPLFLLATADDPFGTSGSLELYRAWAGASRPVELHIYPSGGHGFAMRHQGLAVDNWPALLHRWLAQHGVLAAVD
jgi:acetyl esterase/lipase